MLKIMATLATIGILARPSGGGSGPPRAGARGLAGMMFRAQQTRRAQVAATRATQRRRAARG